MMEFVDVVVNFFVKNNLVSTVAHINSTALIWLLAVTIGVLAYNFINDMNDTITCFDIMSDYIDLPRCIKICNLNLSSLVFI